MIDDNTAKYRKKLDKKLKSLKKHTNILYRYLWATMALVIIHSGWEIMHFIHNHFR